MAIIRPYLGRKKKRKPTAEEREQALKWEKLLAKHSKPLERGAQANGIKNVKGVPKAVPDFKRQNPDIPSLPMSGVATKPISDPAAAEKHAMKARAGINYNKGGVQYLSDLDLKEQKSGTHRRRS